MIEVIFFSMLVIFGVRAAVERNQSPRKKKLEKVWILQPILFCSICMTTLWTPLVFFSRIGWKGFILDPTALVICWLAVPGLIAFIRSIVEGLGLTIMSDELNSLFNPPFPENEK